MSFHKQQKCFGLQPLTPPLKKCWGFWCGGGGEDQGGRCCRKSRTHLWKNPGYAPTKARKITGVLRNVLIPCPGSYFHGSADQESFITEWKLLITSSEKKSDNSGKRLFCEMWRNLCRLRSSLGFRTFWVGMFSRVDTSHFQYTGALC